MKLSRKGESIWVKLSEAVPPASKTKFEMYFGKAKSFDQVSHSSRTSRFLFSRVFSLRLFEFQTTNSHFFPSFWCFFPLDPTFRPLLSFKDQFTGAGATGGETDSQAIKSAEVPGGPAAKKSQ